MQYRSVITFDVPQKPACKPKFDSQHSLRQLQNTKLKETREKLTTLLFKTFFNLASPNYSSHNTIEI